MGLAELEKKSLRKLFFSQVEIPSYYSFRKKILPEIMEKFYDSVNKKLEEAYSICLITDIWTNKSNVDFIALGASITDAVFDKSIFIISMMPMQGSHNAENIKLCVETMVNKYDFNKEKISGMILKFIYFHINNNNLNNYF